MNNWPYDGVPACRIILAQDLEHDTKELVLIIKPTISGKDRAVIMRASAKTRSMTNATPEYIMSRYKYIEHKEFSELMKGHM